ncbi:MAG: hypothetical protein U1E87_08480 [Alphaproteobacteria bacterium]
MKRWWFSVHKWLALVVALQVLAWFASGLFMTAFPIARVRSEHNTREVAPADFRSAGPLVSADQAMAAAGAPVSRLELADIAGRAVWRIDSVGKPFALVDARTGATLSPLDEALAREIAVADFSGSGKIVTAKYFGVGDKPPIEYRSALPVWQIVFDDKEKTHLYVQVLTGKVAARRSGLWRAYDFLWSLHTMDWVGRDNFNNPQIVAFTVLSLVMAASGIGMLVIRFWPRRKREHWVPDAVTLSGNDKPSAHGQ